MNPKIQINKGWTEVIIDDNCGYEKFYKIAKIINTCFDIRFTKKLNGLDTLYWDFVFKESPLVLFYNVYVGTSIFPVNLKESTILDNKNAKEFGSLLYLKIAKLDWAPFEGGATIATTGSENGKIIQDYENSNGARITLEEKCGNIPFAITIGIYGLMFHTQFESDLNSSKEYVLQIQFRINKVFELYETSEDKRNEYWQKNHDDLINEIYRMNEANEEVIQQSKIHREEKGLIEILKSWFI